MKMIRLISVFALLVVMCGASAWALNVPRSESARPSDQAAEGLATAASSSSTADSHVPS